MTTLVGSTRARGQASADESQIKAAFVYNFLKFVEWPVDSFHGPQDAFVVVIIGDGDAADATAQFLTAKQIGDRPLIVRRQKWDQTLAGVHAVFVTELDAKQLRHVLDAASSASVLSIGDGDDFAVHGGVIGLVIDNRKVRFDIDTGAAQAARLRVSSKLLALTRVVHSSAERSGIRP